MTAPQLEGKTFPIGLQRTPPNRVTRPKTPDAERQATRPKTPDAERQATALSLPTGRPQATRPQATGRGDRRANPRELSTQPQQPQTLHHCNERQSQNAAPLHHRSRLLGHRHALQLLLHEHVATRKDIFEHEWLFLNEHEFHELLE